jgi:hypothetical protein
MKFINLIDVRDKHDISEFTQQPRLIKLGF